MPRPQLQHSPIMVLWKTLVVPWLKVNTDGSVRGTNIAAACGGIFQDFSACFRGCFACNLGVVSVLHAEIMVIILAMELAHSFGWFHLWVESDSKLALSAFENSSIVPWDLRNRWSNCLALGLNIVSSHIFREGNGCLDKLAIMVIQLSIPCGGTLCLHFSGMIFYMTSWVFLVIV
ncbi:ribonuclease H [Trifolium pratense]|uniref:Ribonuclease H n=2 Tax=Trifolium pratense TaxID=57577 RepID=A0A2K3M8V9_TRIPR|nr:ribonuclease H [Trifolium pratense]